MQQKMDYSPETPWQVKQFEIQAANGQSAYFDVDDFTEIIDHYILQGDYEQALKVTRYALEMHQCPVPIMLRQSQLLASVQKERKALQILADVELLEPSNPDIYLTRGAVLSQLKQFEEAIAEYNRALALAEEPDAIYCSIAFEYENLGNFDKTIEYLGKALEVNPDNDLAIYEAAYCFDLLSLTEEGIVFFRRLIDKHPYSLEAWFNLGVSYINAGRHELAIDALDYALAIDNGHDHAWFHKGYALSMLERHGEALQAFMSSMAGEEKDALKLYHVGECHEKMEDYDRARQYYVKATHLDPTVIDAWVGLGVCALENGQPAEALSCFEKGIELDPDNASYLCLLGNTQALLGRMMEADASFERALEVDPADQDTWIEYAEMAIGHHEYRKASQIIRRGASTQPDNTALTYRLAACLLLAGRHKEGSYYLEEALLKDFEGHAPMMDKYPSLQGMSFILDIIEKYRP